MTASEVDDAEPPKAKADSWADVDAFIIRSSMMERVAHATDSIGRDYLIVLKFKQPADSAHAGFLYLLTSKPRLAASER